MSKMFLHGLVSGCIAFIVSIAFSIGLLAGGVEPLVGAILSLPVALLAAWAVHKMTVTLSRYVR